MIDDIFLALCLDKCEWLEDIERGDSSLASFMLCVEEFISVGSSKKDLIINLSWLHIKRSIRMKVLA